VALQGTNVTISWIGTGTLQESDNLGSPAAWKAVTPAPTGNTYTVAAAAGGAQKFYRVVR